MPDAADSRHAAPAAWWTRVSGTGVGVAALLGLLAAVVLNPIFATPFQALLGRTLFMAMVLLLAYALGLHAAESAWRPGFLPGWLLPPLAVAVAAPLASSVIYLLWMGGNLEGFVHSGPAQAGFTLITGVGLIVGLLMTLGALLREREARAARQALEFALERERLERQASQARLSLLQRQIEPHFLFNTLANVQALVESGSPRAAGLLQSLIDYLRTAVPDLHEGDATWGRERARVQAYLDLMRMRMPDRLRVDLRDDGTLDARPFPPLGLMTLVENAVRHGVDPREAGGRIEVGAEPLPGGWRCWVADDGPGLHDSAAPGTGLANLRERLQAFPGGRARLALHARQPQGLRAEIVFEEPTR